MLLEIRAPFVIFTACIQFANWFISTSSSARQQVFFCQGPHLTSTSSCSSRLAILLSRDWMVALERVFIWASSSASLAFISLFCRSSSMRAFSSFWVLDRSWASSVVNCSSYVTHMRYRHKLHKLFKAGLNKEVYHFFCAESLNR